MTKTRRTTSWGESGPRDAKHIFTARYFETQCFTLHRMQIFIIPMRRYRTLLVCCLVQSSREPMHARFDMFSILFRLAVGTSNSLMPGKGSMVYHPPTLTKQVNTNIRPRNEIFPCCLCATASILLPRTRPGIGFQIRRSTLHFVFARFHWEEYFPTPRSGIIGMMLCQQAGKGQFTKLLQFEFQVVQGRFGFRLF